MSTVIWIDQNVDNSINNIYAKELRAIKSIEFLELFKNTKEALTYLKKIRFDETIIIVSGRLYSELVEKFKENLLEINTIPKIIVFTSSRSKFIEFNQDYENENNRFYNFGGIASSFKQIEDFFKSKNENIISNKSNVKTIENPSNSKLFSTQIGKILFNKSEEVQLTFEPIDSKEKLVLPLFFKALIDNASNENIENYNTLLYDKYSKSSKRIIELLGPIKSIPNIPIEILSKYYARLYCAESDFYKELNKDLGVNKVDKYLPFIKTLYEGVNLGALPLAKDNILYRGAKISKDEIIKIKNYEKKKIKNLPYAIVFSRSFLSFSKDKDIAKKFLERGVCSENLFRVLYIIEKDDKLEYNLSTHGDIEKIAFIPDEKEVLFFPFSSFEVKKIKEINIGKEKRYEINLLYLGKYLKEIENDKNITFNEIKIPDSEFKKQLTEFGLIKKEKVEKMNTKKLYNKFKKLEKEIKENIIKKEKSENINKKFGANKTSDKKIEEKKIENEKIGKNKNSDKKIVEKEIGNKKFEENKKTDKKIKQKEMKDKKFNENKQSDKKIVEKEIENEKLKDNKISDKKIEENETNNKKNIIIGEIVINKNNINEDLLIINSFENYKKIKNVENKKDDWKYENEKEIKNNIEIKINEEIIKFSYYHKFEKEGKYIIEYSFKKNLINTNYMFCGCNSLTNLNLSNFNTQNVTNMSRMFYNCDSLTNLNLSNFNTQNVTNMSYVFSNCYSLTNLNLSNFNTQNVTDMSNMFSNCKSLSNLNLSNFNTQNVTDMSNMFNYCISLTNLNLSNFNTQNVINMSFLFYGCNSLKKKNIITKDSSIIMELK